MALYLRGRYPPRKTGNNKRKREKKLDYGQHGVPAKCVSDKAWWENGDEDFSDLHSNVHYSLSIN
jgi:hypothetical protein